MRRQLRVKKADGTTEAYLHTKVIGTINHALTAVEMADIVFAEDLSEVVTFYLYSKLKRRTVNSHEIYSMIKAVLAATGQEDAALALTRHTLERRLARARTEVVALEMNDLSDAMEVQALQPPALCEPWNKAQIVSDLTHRLDIPRQTARAVASTVEERVFRIGMTRISRNLIRQLVWEEAAAMLKAERELQTTS
jgi:hypothetical protein